MNFMERIARPGPPLFIPMLLMGMILILQWINYKQSRLIAGWQKTANQCLQTVEGYETTVDLLLKGENK